MEIRKAWSFGDDVKNRNSQKQLDLCAANEMVVQITIYQNTDIHKYTCMRNGLRFIID